MVAAELTLILNQLLPEGSKGSQVVVQVGTTTYPVDSITYDCGQLTIIASKTVALLN